MKLLFVCRGNVGRSQMAEALFKKYSEMNAISAGTKVPQDGPGKEGKRLEDIPVAEPVVRCMRENENIDVSDYKNKQVSPEMLVGIHKIIVMAEPETVPDYLLNDKRTELWSIDDPLHNDYEYYCKIMNQIKTKVLNLIGDLKTT